jgi:hypothetical protein
VKKATFIIGETPDGRVVLDVLIQNGETNNSANWLFEKDIPFEETVKSIPEVFEKMIMIKQ